MKNEKKVKERVNGGSGILLIVGVSTGQIINLYASDSQMIYEGIQGIIPGTIAPFQLLGTFLKIRFIPFLGAIIMLGFYIGWYCLIPVATFFLLLPVSVKLGEYVTSLRRQLQQTGDKRIKLSSELIQVKDHPYSVSFSCSFNFFFCLIYYFLGYSYSEVLCLGNTFFDSNFRRPGE